MIKMRHIFFLISMITMCIGLIENVDYCSSELCGPGYQHVACGHNRQFESNCPADAKNVDSAAMKYKILKEHNHLRNQIATGKLMGYKPAICMATMQWDDELEELASYNVKSCQMKHDACHNTHKFSYSGQNLGYISYSDSENKCADDEYCANAIIQSWWHEHKVCNMRYLYRFPASYNGDVFSHFTLMTGEANTHVGCAAARFTSGNMHTFLLACNYAITNMIDSALYRAGKTASACRNGTNVNYAGLCSTEMLYDYKPLKANCATLEISTLLIVALVLIRQLLNCFA